MSMPPPKMTADGKYVCTVDNTAFDNQDDYNMHCMKAHTAAGGGKTW